MHSGISAVAAMQFTISDPAAIAFARGFYAALVHGRSVDEAARSGRISILGTPGTMEWVTPVLYVRGEVTRLFKLTVAAQGGISGEQRAAQEQPGIQGDEGVLGCVGAQSFARCASRPGPSFGLNVTRARSACWTIS
jgi:hypothetical protein